MVVASILLLLVRGDVSRLSVAARQHPHIPLIVSMISTEDKGDSVPGEHTVSSSNLLFYVSVIRLVRLGELSRSITGRRCAGGRLHGVGWG